MNTLVKIGIGVGILAVAVAVVPALKGPYNRFKNAANEKLDSEFIVDNYKAEYISLHEKRQEIMENINKFKVEKKVAEKKFDYACDKQNAAKNNLIKIGTTNINDFNRAKDIYESAKAEVSNYSAMINAYSNALVKLEDSLYLVNSNMSKAKTNVATLESKKVLVDSIKAVNKTVESLNGVGDSKLGINIEKLDDDALRESIKLEALRDNIAPQTMDKAAADAYIQSLKD